MREPQDFSPCLFARRAIGDPLGKTDSKQAVACWSVSVGGLPPLLSHFPLQLKLGKIRRSPGERCHPARRATGDPLGRLDSVAAGEGANAVSVAWDPTRYVLMDLAEEISQ